MRDFSWAVGVFEGEGTISILSDGNENHRRRVRLCIGSTDLDVITEVHRIFNVGNVNGPYKGVNKPCWKWVCGSNDEVEQLLKRMLPILCGRRAAKAKQALDVMTANKGRRRGQPAHEIYLGETR